MAISTEAIRRITIEGKGQNSLQSLASSVDRVKAAQNDLARATLAEAAADERLTAATAAAIAMQERFAKAGDVSAIAQEKVAQAQDKVTRAAEQVTAAHNGVTAAQGRLTQATSTTATVTDMQTKRSLSAAEAYRRQTLSVVDGARQQDQLARATGVVDAALKQGIITTDQHAARINLLNQKYGEGAVATRGMAAATSFLSQAVAPLMAMLSVGAVIGFGEKVFESTSRIKDQADQASSVQSSVRHGRHRG